MILRKHIWILGLFILLLSNFVTAETKLYDFDTPFKIIQQDYMQEYIDYNFYKVDDGWYRMVYKVNNPLFFEGLKCKTDFCINELAEENKEEIINYEKNTKGFLGFKTDYTLDSFNKEYLIKDSKTLDTKTIDEHKNYLTVFEEFPKTVIEGNIYLSGVINPFEESGYINIFLDDNQKHKFKVGFETLIVEFDPDYETENVSIQYTIGIKDTITRYLGLSRYSSINSALINITGMLGNHSPYTLLDRQFTNTTKYNQTISYSGNCATYTTNVNDGYLQISTQPGWEACSSGSGSIRTFQYYNIANFDSSANFSIILPDYSVNLYCTRHSSCGSCTTSNYAHLVIRNSTTSRGVQTWSIPTCSAGSVTDTTYNERLKLIYNNTNKQLYIYNAITDALINNLSYMSGSLSLEFYVSSSVNKVTNYPAGARTTLSIFSGILKNDNIQAINWSYTNVVYPEDLDLSLAGTSIYSNSTYFDDSRTVDFTATLNTKLLNGNCDCTGCILSDQCYVPMVFSSSNGGKLNYDNIKVNITYTASNLTVNLIDTSTNTKLNTTNITVQAVGEIYQLQNINDTGTVLFEVPFSGITGDTVSLRAFSTYNNDYSLVQQIHTLEQGNNYNINMYLTNTSNVATTKEVKFIVVTEDRLRIEGALISIYKQDPATNQFLLITEIYSNPSGEATTILEKDTAFYKFVVTFQDVEIYVSANPVQITSSDDTVNLNCVVGKRFTETAINLQGLTAYLTFTKTNNHTGYYTLYYNSKNNVEICANVTKIINNAIVDIEYTCVEGLTGLKQYSTIVADQYTISDIKLYADFGDGFIFILSRFDYLGLDDLERQNTGRLFIFFGLIIIAGIVFIYSPNMGLLIFMFGNLILMITKFLNLSPTIYITIISLTIFVLITLNRNKNV